MTNFRKCLALMGSAVLLGGAILIYVRVRQRGEQAGGPAPVLGSLLYTPQVNLGKLPYIGELVNVAVPFKNMSSRAIVVESIRKDCNCTEARFVPSATIPANGQSVLQIAIDLERRKTLFGVDLALYADDGHTYPLMIRLQLEEALVFGGGERICRISGVVPDQKTVFHSRIAWAGEVRCPLEVTCDLPFVKASLEASQGPQADFSLTVNPISGANIHYGMISFVNSKSSRRILAVPLMIYAVDNTGAGGIAKPSALSPRQLPKGELAPDSETRNRLRMILESMEKNSDTAIINLASSGNLSIQERILAIRALSRLGSDQAIHLILGLARQSGLTIGEKEAVAASLRALSDRHADALLQEARKEQEGEYRTILLKALAEGQSQRSFSAAQQEFSGASPKEREAMLASLGQFPDTLALGFLRDLALTSRREPEAYLAVVALAALKSQAAGAALREIASSSSLAREQASLHAFLK